MVCYHVGSRWRCYVAGCTVLLRYVFIHITWCCQRWQCFIFILCKAS